MKLGLMAEGAVTFFGRVFSSRKGQGGRGPSTPNESSQKGGGASWTAQWVGERDSSHGTSGLKSNTVYSNLNK